LMPASCGKQKPNIDGVYRKIGEIAPSKSNPFVNINDDDEIQLDNFSFIEALRTSPSSPRKELPLTRCSLPLDRMQLALNSSRRLHSLLVDDEAGSDWATTALGDDAEECCSSSPLPEARENPELVFYTHQIVSRQRKRRRRNTILGPPAPALQNVAKNNLETRLPCLDSFYSCSSYYSDVDEPEKLPQGISQNYMGLANQNWQEVFGDSTHTRLKHCERHSKASSCIGEDQKSYDIVKLSAADVKTLQGQAVKASCSVRAGSNPAPSTVLSLQRGQSTMRPPYSSFYNLAALDST
jgi:hypothetical protein